MGRFHSLRAKAITALLVVALVPSAILAILWYRTAVSGLLRNINASLIGSAARAAASVDGYLDASLDAVRTQAQFAAIRRHLVAPTAATRREAQELLATLANSDPVNLASLSLVAPDGRIVLSSDGLVPPGATVRDSLVLSALHSLVPVITPVRFRATDPANASFVVAAAVRDAAGRAIGVLLVEHEAAILDQILRTETGFLGARAQALLYDEHTIRLAGSFDPATLFYTTNPLDSATRRALVADRRLQSDSVAPMQPTRRIRGMRINRDSTLSYTVRQTPPLGAALDFLAGSSPLRVRPWRVSVELPRQEAFGPILRSLLGQSLALGVLSLLAVALVAVAIASALTRPIVHLAEASRRFADGDLGARATVGSRDEIGALADAFNDLADRIGNLVAGLEQRTRQLEDDIARREQLEQELVLTRKMEAVGRLAGGIAHDFNNLLTVIAQNAELAATEPGSSATQREALLDITDAADRGAGLTRQLLAFAKRGVTAPRVLDACEVVRGNERLLRQVLGAHIRLEVVLPPHALGIFADHTQCEQVLVNLAANARDAMSRGGTVRIEVREEPRAIGFAAGAVVIECSDTGVGMTPEIASRVFEPFFTTKEESRGTGLGLSTVYGIVTQAGGTVGVTSAPGAGSTFTIRYPRRAEAAAVVGGRSGDGPSASPPPARGTILLVEDEMAVRHVVARTLRRAGFTVHEAGDGTEGIALGRLHRDRIDLLLTDVVMPGADGFAVAATLRAERPSLKVLMMSGYSTEARAQFGDGAPPYLILEKPVSGAALVEAVTASIENRR